MLFFAEADAADEVDQLAEALLVERGTGVALGEDIFELGWVVAFDGFHGAVDEGADAGLLGVVFEVAPAGVFRHPEDAFGGVFVAFLGSFDAEFREKLGVAFFEGVGDVLEEDEPEDDVLVFGGVHVAAELVGGSPEDGFDILGRGVLFLSATGAGHVGFDPSMRRCLSRKPACGRSAAGYC